MGVRFDASSSGETNTVTLSYSHTLDTGANFLAVCIEVMASSATSISDVTVDGESIVSNLVIVDQRAVPLTTIRLGSAIYFMPSPPTGTVTIEISIDPVTGDPRIISGCSSWFDVDLSDPIGDSDSAKGDSTGASVTLTAQALDDAAVDSLTFFRTLADPVGTAGADQVELWNRTVGPALLGVNGCGSYELATSSSVTMSWGIAPGANYVYTAAVIRGSGTRLLAQMGVGQ